MAPITSIIKIKRQAGEPFARDEVRVNGSHDLFMYVDTARLVTAISFRAQEVLQLHTTNRTMRVGVNQIRSADAAQCSSFQIARLDETVVEQLRVYVTDVQFVDGRIGMNYLSQFLRVCYDFSSETLQLTR